MEKQGRVDPAVTPDTEHKLPVGEKAASGEARKQQIRQLDDDTTKRGADAVADRLK